MGDKMIEEVKAADLTPDTNNANRHSERGEYMVSRSIEKFGFRFAGTLDKHRGIVHGNNRHEKAGAAGIEDVVIIKADPNKQYYLQYDDLDLDDPTNPARELAIVANRSAQVSIDFDPAVIAFDLEAGMELGDWFKPYELDMLTGNNGQSWGDSMGQLPDGDRAPFQQMTFTLSDEQAEQVKRCLDVARRQGAFANTGNENGNGNALARVCETFLTDYGNG